MWGYADGEFLMGLGMLLMVSVLLTIFIHHQIHSATHRQVSRVLAVATPLLYMLTALSNPGVYRSAADPRPKTRYCHTCLH